MTMFKPTTRKLRLNNRNVEALPIPPKGAKPVPYYDDLLVGFYVQISDRGTKTFYSYGRLPGSGRQARQKIGRYGVLTADQARTQAKRLLGGIAAGHDFAAEKRAARQAENARRAAPRVSDLADRYLVEHVNVHNKPTTRAEFRRMIDRIIRPQLGQLKVNAVRRDDVASLHRDLAETPRQADHVLAVISKMMNLAELWGMRLDGSNPCRHIKRYGGAARDRFLSVQELERLGATLREMEAEGSVKPAVAGCIRLLLLTGMRLSEAVNLEWPYVDLCAGVLRLPDGKAGGRLVPLGAPALALIADMNRDGSRVFADLTPAKVEKAWAGDRPDQRARKRGRPGIRDRAAINDARIHDLRHTTGTYAGAAGLNAFIVRDLLGHRTMSMAARYVSRNADPLRAAADVVSAQIAAALDGAPRAEVVALRSVSK
jgi:integrase